MRNIYVYQVLMMLSDGRINELNHYGNVVIGYFFMSTVQIPLIRSEKGK